MKIKQLAMLSIFLTVSQVVAAALETNSEEGRSPTFSYTVEENEISPESEETKTLQAARNQYHEKLSEFKTRESLLDHALWKLESLTSYEEPKALRDRFDQHQKNLSEFTKREHHFDIAPGLFLSDKKRTKLLEKTSLQEEIDETTDEINKTTQTILKLSEGHEKMKLELTKKDILPARALRSMIQFAKTASPYVNAYGQSFLFLGGILELLSNKTDDSKLKKTLGLTTTAISLVNILEKISDPNPEYSQNLRSSAFREPQLSREIEENTSRLNDLNAKITDLLKKLEETNISLSDINSHQEAFNLKLSQLDAERKALSEEGEALLDLRLDLRTEWIKSIREPLNLQKSQLDAERKALSEEGEALSSHSIK